MDLKSKDTSTPLSFKSGDGERSNIVGRLVFQSLTYVEETVVVLGGAGRKGHADEGSL